LIKVGGGQFSPQLLKREERKMKNFKNIESFDEATKFIEKNYKDIKVIKGQLEAAYEAAVNDDTTEDLKNDLHSVVGQVLNLLGNAKNKAVRAAIHKVFPYMVTEAVVTPAWCYCGECGKKKSALLDIILYPETTAAFRFNLGAFPTGECLCE
jgi:hypothetical protein